MTKIVFTGRGIIGHVSVDLSLVPTALSQGCETLYIGFKNGIEREIIESRLPEIKYYPISSGKLRRYISLGNAEDMFRVLKGILDARKVLKEEKPDLLFSKDGFVSVPTVITAKSLNIPTPIHESDLTPESTNKIALKFAKKIYTTFEETLSYLPEEKADFIGATVREDLKDGNAHNGYQLTGFSENKKVLLIIGGSLGSKELNSIIHENLDALLQQYRVIHLTGKRLKDTQAEKSGYMQYKFVKKDLTDSLVITDTAVNRAGSNAIYEFLTLRIPMLLVPLGLDQSRSGQIDNTNHFVGEGYAKAVGEERLTAQVLLQELDEAEQERTRIINNMESYGQSYTKEALFDKMIRDALN